LVDALRGTGVAVEDHGDRDVWRRRPDRANRRAHNLGGMSRRGAAVRKG
jgi:hypothetical protein